MVIQSVTDNAANRAQKPAWPLKRRKRVAFTNLPEETLRVLDRIAPRDNRSRLILDAVMDYVTAKTRSNLAERLKQGALVNAQRDLELAREWFP
jgi:CopG family transcriptional regulator / antitoxin EndoAI